jgi:hypothetical protein
MENNEPGKKVVKTYAEDVAQTIEGSSGDIIRKIIHSEEETEKERQNSSPESQKNRLFLYISMALLFVAVALFTFFILHRKPATVPVEEQFNSIIFNDKVDFLDVSDYDKDTLAQNFLEKVKASGVKDGGVEGIYLTENKKIVGLRRFLALIKSSFNPGDPKFVADNFLMGFVNNQNLTPPQVPARDFFMIIKVRSISDIFDNLRAWEGKMFYDLHGFLGVYISSDTSYLLTKDFVNGLVENKNARILYDKAGKDIVLAYIFADNNSVVIAGGEAAAREVMVRLAASQK